MSKDAAADVSVALPHSPDLEELARLSQLVRWHIVNTVAQSKAGHIGGPMSMTDLLVALYFAELRIDPANPLDPARDRFVLSKGHSAIGLYGVLALRGYFPVDELATFDRGNSRLQGHPDMKLTPGIDVSTGSLGQGLSAAVGIALAARKQQSDHRTWVVLGDGELQEGMVWEAVNSASRYELSNLIAIVDLNGLQQFGWPADASRDRFDRSDPWAHVNLRGVFEGFGWNVLDADGHDFSSILEAYSAASDNVVRTSRPTVILARTVKGHGLSFTQGTYKWHNGVATDEQLQIARNELQIEETNR
ncbi:MULTISPECIES: transketolase [unclassified Microbacterium]|uniref:transketolase n=1 Tax=unclassified Microbacterium TaxID=2609290 RepID=UPI000C2BC9A3|nr:MULTISPECIES: transketolase [unclassified Microbacterium]